MFAGLIVLAIALAMFGCWGEFTAASNSHFDEEMGAVPLLAIGAAPLIIVFGFLFLDATPSSRMGPKDDEAHVLPRMGPRR